MSLPEYMYHKRWFPVSSPVYYIHTESRIIGMSFQGTCVMRAELQEWFSQGAHTMNAGFMFYAIYSKWVLGYRHEFDKVYILWVLAHCFSLEYINHECWVTLRWVWWVHEPQQYTHHEYWLSVLFLTQYFYNKIWWLGLNLSHISA